MGGPAAGRGIGGDRHLADYAIVLRLRALGFDDLAEGTVYPALTRMEKKGLLASRLVPSDSGPARKYYRLTKAGRAELSRAVKYWAGLRSNIDRVMAAPDTRLKSTTS